MNQTCIASVAIIEDEPSLCSDLVDYLQMCGYAARGFNSAEAFYKAWPATKFDLLILDVALPGASGLEIAEKVREQDSTGIVILSALGRESDLVSGLNAGADVYLKKDCSLEVIDANCRSVLRRLKLGVQTPTEHTLLEWRLCCRAMYLISPGLEKINLTYTEAVFLKCLFQQSDVPVNRFQLLSEMGKPDTLSNLRNLDNCASRLRRKILKACSIEIPIHTSYGNGYMFSGNGYIDNT